MAPRKRSLVWTYFKMIDAKTVQCLLCTVCVVHNGPTTTNMMRHLRTKHPAEIGGDANGDHRKSQHGSEMTENNDDDLHIHGNFDSVEVEMDNDETRPITVDDSADITSAINGILEAAEGVAVRTVARQSTADGPSLRRRSSVWKHYKRLESPTSSLCLLCMEEIKHYNSTSNLKRHLSKKHPGAFAGLGFIVNEQSSKTSVHLKPVQNKSPTKSSTSVVNEKRTDLFDVSRERMREDEIGELERVRELIEAVRNAQRQEAKALEHQRELLEMLRDANARELAAERERIESLRKAQEKESIALDKRREELHKEKEELQLKWEQLEQNKKETCTCQL